MHGLAWLTVAVLPVLALLFVQLAFLPYHDVTITAATVPDGRAEVIVGSGPTARASVRVYDASAATALVIDTIRPLGGNFLGGVSVSAARVNDDVVPEIIVAAGRRGGGAEWK